MLDFDFLPYAVKHSYAGREESAASIRKEAATMAALRGLPGVLQGEGVVYEDQGERVCSVTE